MSDQVQAGINANWNTVAASYAGAPHHTVKDDPERQVWLNTVRPLLPPPPADVLDIGTGTGILALVCAKLGHRVTGIDLSEGMLATGRSIAAERAKMGSQTYPLELKVGNPGPGLPRCRHPVWTWYAIVMCCGHCSTR